MAWDSSKYAGYKVTKLKANGPAEGQEVEQWLYGKDQVKQVGRHRRGYAEGHAGHWKDWRKVEDC